MHPDISVRGSPIEGRGIFADRLLPKGTVLMDEAIGTFVTFEELQQLPEDKHHLAYRHGDRYFLGSDGSEYMNHSCDPNTHWQSDDVVVASRDIHPDEELTYDYATSEIHTWWRAKWICDCGTPNCRGYITGRDCLDPAFAARHHGRLPSWTVEFMRRHSGVRGRLSWLLFAGAEVYRRLRSMGQRSWRASPAAAAQQKRMES
ncbi:MAG: SET domain-containing protein-lysine N-methyltransferase [Pseudomonadota bacterium]